MGLALRSYKNRSVHLGRLPLETLLRVPNVDLDSVPDFEPLTFRRPNQQDSIVNAMGDHQAMLDAIRDGLINKSVADVPVDLIERANHLKALKP